MSQPPNNTALVGSAKKFNGDAANLVIIFNWDTGHQIAVIYPDATTGEWSYQPVYDEPAGITYIAYGCAPVTHGPYDLVSGKILITSGYLLISISTTYSKPSESKYDPQLDSLFTDHSTWLNNFSQTIDVGLFNYNYGPAVQTTTSPAKIIEQFNPNWKLHFFGTNATAQADYHKSTLELLDINNNVIFALRSEQEAPKKYSCNLYFGRGLNEYQEAPKIGIYRVTNGHLTFTPTKVIFTNIATGSYNGSFEFLADITSVVKIRVSGESKSTYPYGASAGTWIKVIEVTSV